MNATSVSKIGATTMPSKGYGRLKKSIGSHFGANVPRNEVRNGENYVNMDGRFHKRRGDVERYYDSYDHYEHSYSSNNMYNEHNYSYSYGGQKFKLVLKSLSYEVNVWWDCKCENRRRMGAKPIETWSLVMTALRNIFGVESCEGQRQGQQKVKFKESSMVEESPKVKELSQAKN
ncbi:hypothetical protein M9H77_16666 [Catharanthus roseus]|uniref:Uncharacterized protein n=1 Tax=Catharanthus roseus TaxID=4058 RepID=A0ACC0B2E6_CATRO|nr:hypothetical protein M9H77_16666 [Catharanthus roseus]